MEASTRSVARFPVEQAGPGISGRALDDASLHAISWWQNSVDRFAGMGFYTWLIGFAAEALRSGERRGDVIHHRGLALRFESHQGRQRLVGIERVSASAGPPAPSCSTCRDSGRIRKRLCDCTTEEWFAGCKACKTTHVDCPDCRK